MVCNSPSRAAYPSHRLFDLRVQDGAPLFSPVRLLDVGGPTGTRAGGPPMSTGGRQAADLNAHRDRRPGERSLGLLIDLVAGPVGGRVPAPRMYLTVSTG
jgi:hypothetical protein